MITIENGIPVYTGDTFKIRLVRYSDPERLNAARNAAIYLGKSDVGNVRRPLNIIRQGHVAEVFRGEHAEFIFDDVSKSAYDHICTYTTRTMRVAGGNRALRSDGFTMPLDKMKDERLVFSKVASSMQNYYDLLDAKETPQIARSAMPVNAKMNRHAFQFNFLTLGQSLFKQRIWERGTQGDTAKVVQAMYELCNYVDSELWETFYQWFGEPAAEWIEVRRKVSKSKLTVEGMIDVLQKSLIGELKNKKGEVVHHAEPDELIFESLRKIYGEQHSMW